MTNLKDKDIEKNLSDIKSVLKRIAGIEITDNNIIGTYKFSNIKKGIFVDGMALSVFNNGKDYIIAHCFNKNKYVLLDENKAGNRNGKPGLVHIQSEFGNIFSLAVYVRDSHKNYAKNIAKNKKKKSVWDMI